LELWALLHPGRRPASEPQRLGFGLEPAQEPTVTPLLAFDLDEPTQLLRDRYPDLWAVDLRFWQQLDHREDRRIRWLRSPGRRLAQSLSTLEHAPNQVGATDVSVGALLAAAMGEGPEGDQPPAWTALHRAVPGPAMFTWLPPEGRSLGPALAAMENPGPELPTMARYAALAYLMRAAAEQEVFELHSVRRALRDELPTRIALMLALDAMPEAATRRRLERATLQRAAQVAATANVAATWHVARWIQGCLIRSPFYGGDAELLAVRLEALAGSPAAPTDADALAPARFTKDGLHLDEVGFVSAVLAHYSQQNHLLPPPSALIERLRELAQRPLRSGELEAEAAHRRRESALGWFGAEVPLAPPLAARRVLTQLKLSWVGGLDHAAQHQAIELFDAAPRRYRWMAAAWRREPPAGHRHRLAEVWRSRSELDAPDRAFLGIAALEALDEDDHRGLLASIQASGSWQVPLLDALAAEAQSSGSRHVAQDAVEALVALAENERTEPETRVNAAAYALSRSGGASSADETARSVVLTRLQALLSKAPFREHVGLRRELRRLGFESASAMPRKFG
jgi:hypothetical protein